MNATPAGTRKVGSQLPGSESMAEIVGGWEQTPALLVGRYRLEELIGRGGTGEVWRGHDLRPDWPVAVKLLLPEVADIPMRERFAREARTAARIVHRNVVTVFDVGEHEGRPFLVMELLAGRDLATELAENGPLDVSAVCRLVGQAAIGLDAAHRAGVVHRDVKPANLRRSADGVLKVVDFGTARVATEAAARLTSTGSVIGTAAYLSPEQILGEAGTAASDLYALGCVCYELLCGRPPFVGPVSDLISQHVRDLPDPLRRHRPDVPAELERLVLALLEKDPAARPASGEIVRRVLAEVVRRAVPRARDGVVSPLPGPGRSPEPRTAVISTAETHTTRTRAPEAWTAETHTAEVWAAKLIPDRLRRRHVGAALGVVAVLMVGVVWTSAPSDPAESAGAVAILSAQRSVPPSPSPTVSRSVSAVPSPAPSRPPRPSPAAVGWQARLQAFSRAVTDQEQRGGIDAKLARRLREKIAKITRKLQEGKGRDVRGELRDLGRDLARARQKGELASEGPLVVFLRESGFALPAREHESDD